MGFTVFLIVLASIPELEVPDAGADWPLEQPLVMLMIVSAATAMIPLIVVIRIARKSSKELHCRERAGEIKSDRLWELFHATPDKGLPPEPSGTLYLIEVFVGIHR